MNTWNEDEFVKKLKNNHGLNYNRAYIKKDFFPSKII